MPARSATLQSFAAALCFNCYASYLTKFLIVFAAFFIAFALESPNTTCDLRFIVKRFGVNTTSCFSRKHQRSEEIDPASGCNDKPLIMATQINHESCDNWVGIVYYDQRGMSKRINRLQTPPWLCVLTSTIRSS